MFLTDTWPTAESWLAKNKPVDDWLGFVYVGCERTGFILAGRDARESVGRGFIYWMPTYSPTLGRLALQGVGAGSRLGRFVIG